MCGNAYYHYFMCDNIPHDTWQYSKNIMHKKCVYSQGLDLRNISHTHMSVCMCVCVCVCVCMRIFTGARPRKHFSYTHTPTHTHTHTHSCVCVYVCVCICVYSQGLDLGNISLVPILNPGDRSHCCVSVCVSRRDKSVSVSASVSVTL